MSVISLKNVSKIYKKKVKNGFIKGIFRPEFSSIYAVKGISFEINQGESVAFLGKNGAGKTTTIKMLSGLVFPNEGEINILGFNPFDRKAEFLQNIGLVMGNKAGLNWDLTAKQSFELLKQIYRIPDDIFKERLDKLTELLEIKKFLDTQVRRMSLGERMKMEIIGSLLHHPKILFLDEPTIGLDIYSKKKIREFLRQVQNDYGVTILLTSHDMDDVENVCDRVIIIDQGQKIYDNTLESLTEQYKQERYVKFVFEGAIKNLDIQDIKAEVIASEAYSITYKVNQSEMPKLISLVTSKYKLKDIEILSVPLEEIVMKVV